MSRDHNDHYAGLDMVQPNELHAEAIKSSIAEQAIALYGADAPTAIAFCALEAWTEDEGKEFSFWTELFKRLNN